MTLSIQQKILLSFWFLLLLSISYVRENLAIEINAIIDGYDYNRASFYWFQQWLGTLNFQQLTMVKWGLVGVFYPIFTLLATFIIHFSFHQKKYTFTTLNFYSIILLVLILVTAVAYPLGYFDAVYFFLRKLLGFVFSPLPVFMLWLVFYSFGITNNQTNIKKNNRTVVFVHIPKTAGSTLHTILDDFYQLVFHVDGLSAQQSLQKFYALSKEQQNSFEVVKGHLTLRLLEYIENPFVITYLRNPVDLFLSQYYYVKRANKSKHHKDVKNMSIEDFIEFVKAKGYDNLQTRHLSNATLHITDESSKPIDFDTQGEEMLAKAKINMDTFDMVFDVKDFDASLIVLKKSLNWKKTPYYLAKNVTKKRTLQTALSDDLIGKIEALNTYDMQLYQYFKSKDRRQNDKQALAKEINSFKLKNRIYQQIAQPIKKMEFKIYRFYKRLL